MKSRHLPLLAALLISGCEIHSITYVEEVPPPAPAAVSSITADHAVYLSWEAGSSVPIDHFRVYRSEAEGAPLHYLGYSVELGYVDHAVVNGVTYHYGISSVSTAGIESQLSYIVGDTPRPEGYDLVLFDLGTRPDRSGFDFATLSRVAYDDPRADIILESDAGGSLWLWAAGPGTDLQDMGYTHSLDDITASPIQGWNPEGVTLLITGHTYVIWTNDNHFAKLRAVEVATTWARLDWAYQVDPGNPELVKPAHDSAYGRRLPALQPVLTGLDHSGLESEVSDSHSAGTRGARELR